ncbi:Serpin B9 [Mizuhopecten yessoensis]|uniref:Serpin B9 n=1 Tax=Mizuhopecten yessoensis TaxID=6573 RepID=A0A210Q6S2_MIZYE|nr:Serpin B9 [Mizuhopecten yessoensis]
MASSSAKIFRNDILHKDFQDSNMEFTWELYKRLMATSPGDNLFYSPFSISAAMSMVFLGARGQTAVQMGPALKLQSLGQRVHEAFEDYLQVAMIGNKEVTLRIANRLYPNQKTDIMSSFFELCKKHYQTDIKAMNYDPPETARNEINGWVSVKTAQKINDLLPEGSLNPMTVMVLVNAIYFKAEWMLKFDQYCTKEGTFHTLNGRQEKVQMMSNVDKHFCMKRDEKLKCSALELPYKGNALSMVVILPDDKDGLSALEDSLTPSKLHGLIKHMTPTAVNVTLPKFKLESEFELSKIFKEMGMADLFEASKADMSGLDASGKTYLSAIFHKTFVDVTETGTEAAAATAVAMNCCMSMKMPLVFDADHPFIFLIKDNRSDTILFCGRFVDVASV